VQNAALVSGIDGVGQGGQQFGGGSRRTGLAAQGLGQVAPLHVLQGEVGPAVVLAHLVHLHNVGMLQPRRYLRLGAEAAPLLLAGERLRQDHLQGDQPPQTLLPGQVDHSHAASTQLAQDLVAGHHG
jgi:hypothetical protein